MQDLRICRYVGRREVTMVCRTEGDCRGLVLYMCKEASDFTWSHLVRKLLKTVIDNYTLKSLRRSYF